MLVDKIPMTPQLFTGTNGTILGRTAWEEFEMIVENNSSSKDRGVSFTSTLPTFRKNSSKNSFQTKASVNVDNSW